MIHFYRNILPTIRDPLLYSQTSDVIQTISISYHHKHRSHLKTATKSSNVKTDSKSLKSSSLQTSVSNDVSASPIEQVDLKYVTTRSSLSRQGVAVPRVINLSDEGNISHESSEDIDELVMSSSNENDSDNDIDFSKE